VLLAILLIALLEPRRVFAESAEPIPIRVAVLVNFEIGADSGDTPGEFQNWFERGLGAGPLEECLDLPFSTHRACIDRDAGLLVTYTGLSQDRAAASVMAMGLDPRFDFSQSYWIIGGIAGIDPHDGTLGSAVWGRYVVNGDWGHEIDAREMPGHWSTGYLPFMRKEPYAEPMRDEQRKVYALNASLAQWAFELTRGVPLKDTSGAAALRSDYIGYPKALAAPTVMLGDNLSASTFWHGELYNQWANDWLSYWTDGKGEFVTTAVEDGGILEAIRFLDGGGRADFSRVMLLRTASNFSMQPPGMSAAQSLTRDSDGFGGMEPAIEAHWLVGSTAARALIEGWKNFETTTPTP
jgi:purine nucleoside permease